MAAYTRAAAFAVEKTAEADDKPMASATVLSAGLRSTWKRSVPSCSDGSWRTPLKPSLFKHEVDECIDAALQRVAARVGDDLNGGGKEGKEGMYDVADCSGAPAVDR